MQGVKRWTKSVAGTLCASAWPLDLDSCRCQPQPRPRVPHLDLITTLRPKISLLAKWVVAVLPVSMNPLQGHPPKERGRESRCERRGPRERHREGRSPSQSMKPLPRHPPRERRIPRERHRERRPLSQSMNPLPRHPPRERHREGRPPSENVPATQPSCCSRLQASPQRLPIC